MLESYRLPQYISAFLVGRTSSKEVHVKPICIYDYIVGVCRDAEIDLNSSYFQCTQLKGKMGR